MLDGVRSTTRWRRAVGGVAVAALLVALAGSGSRPAAADGGPNRRGVSAWLPYYGNQADRRASFIANIDLFEEISPFWYHLGSTPSTILADGSDFNMDAITSVAADRGVPVIPTIRDGSGKGTLAAWLADPVTRTQHADALVALVVQNGFAGIDLDYEGFAFTDGRDTWDALRPNWVAFVQELGFKIRSQGRQLHVTVPPIWFQDGQLRGYWVYDWAGIAPYVDGLRVMTYDYSSGPVSPLWWWQSTISYAQSIGFDMSKLQLGLPMYGYDAVTATEGVCPSGAPVARVSRNQREVDKMLAEKGATPQRDPGSGEMTFSYQATYVGTGTTAAPGPTPTEPVPQLGGLGTATATVGAARVGTCTVTRTVWYLDQQAVALRAKAAVDAGAGVAMWAIGMEQPFTWTALRSQLAVQR